MFGTLVSCVLPNALALQNWPSMVSQYNPTALLVIQDMIDASPLDY